MVVRFTGRPLGWKAASRGWTSFKRSDFRRERRTVLTNANNRKTALS
jgi:hypothetical protein